MMSLLAMMSLLFSEGFVRRGRRTEGLAEPCLPFLGLDARAKCPEQEPSESRNARMLRLRASSHSGSSSSGMSYFSPSSPSGRQGTVPGVRIRTAALPPRESETFGETFCVRERAGREGEGDVLHKLLHELQGESWHVKTSYRCTGVLHV